MANPVDAVIGSEAIKQVQNLVAQLTVADSELVKISQSALLASKSIAGISPKSFNDSVNTNVKLGEQLEKLKAKYVSLNDTISKKVEQSRLAEIRLQKQREKAFDSFEKNANKETAIVEKNSNAYNKTQQQINRVTIAYNDLAARKERYNNLSVNEEMRLKTLQSVTERYNGTLKSIDSTIGKNNRNVGNYASGWNGLGNSINQLTREAPAFAVSMNTGFLAISNNIPALVDEINKLKKANIDLAASGEPTKSIFKQLGGAIFSWQTLISLGVTLLTLYGGKLIDMIKGLGDVEAKLKLVEAQQARYNKRLEEANSTIDHNLILEKNRLRQIGANTEQLNLLDRKATEAKLRNAEATRNSIKRDLDEETKKILTKKQLLGVSFVDEIGISQKLNAKKIELEKSLGKELVKFTYLARTDKEKADVESLAQTNNKIRVLEELNNSEIYKKKKEAYVKAENLARTAGSSLSELVSTQNADRAEAERNANEKTIKDINKVKETKEKSSKSQQTDFDKELEALKEIEAAVKTIQDAQNAIAENKAIIQEIEKEVTLKQFALIDKEIERLEKLKQATENYLKSFSSEFFSKSGFSETFDILNGDIEGFGENAAVTFNAIAESAQEAFNFISNASQQNFDAEYSRLQSQKEIALMFAGDSASAKAKIEEDAEKKRKEIANRENKAKQKQAIFNIAIDTAQGIISALASTPPNVPLSIAIGVLGAAQIGIVAAQKIPQYWEGTDNHGGGLMMVNDAKGNSFQEKVIFPNGNEFMPQGRNVVMDAPAGTKVLTPEQQLMSALNGTNINLSKETINRTNNMTLEQMDYILGKHFSKIQTNTTNIDKRGITQWSERNGNRTIQNNNRVSGTGFSV